MKNATVVKSAGALALAMSCFVPASYGVPYATSLINNSGIVSFRLNEAADDVKVIGNGGTLTIDLRAGAVGVTTVDLTGSGMTGGVFQVVVIKVGSGSITQIGETSVSSIRGVSVNTWPATPAFGRVYASAATGSGATAGVNVYESDLTAPFTNPRTAGYNFAGASGSKPFHSNVGSDGQVYLTDWSDASGNLIVTDPDVSSFQYVLQPLSGTAAIPVGSANNHGSVQAVAALGTLAGGNLLVYTVDEDYQQDPTSTVASQMNSLWRYRINGGPLPYTAVPELLAVPTIGFVSQNDDVAVGPNGYIYFNQRRANSSGPPGTGTFSPSLYIVNPNVYIDPTTYGTVYDPSPANQPGQPGCLTVCSNYWSHPAAGGWIWDSQSASTDIGSAGADYLIDINGVSVSPDGRYMADFKYGNCFLGITPLTSGIPDLSQRFGLATGLISAARSVAWDAADNVYVASSGSAVVRVYSLGISSTATTGSDGTFQLAEFKCPADITVNNDPGICGARVTYTSPGGTQTAGLPSGSTFPVGTTLNTFELMGTNSCSFTVTVVDNEPPVMLCASNKVVECGTAWSFDPPSAFDNCTATNVLISEVSTVTNAGCGGSFTATRTWQAIDNNPSNTAVCSQTVMVVDTTPPTVVCPSPITVEFQNPNGAVVSFVVTASDGCSSVSLAVTPASGSVFPIGVTTVQATAVDACTNASQCSFTVTVLGASGVKSNVLAGLIALRASTTLGESFAAKLDYAILHLQNSFNPAYWIDETHLQPAGGNTALNEEKLAATMLDVIASSKQCPVDPAILQGFIARILKSDRLLAIISIQEDTSAGLNPKKIAEDLEQVAKGDEEAAAGRYANAIEHYRNAWRHAIQLRLQVSQDGEGVAQVRFVGNNSKSYLVEVSMDLVNWVPLGTYTADAEGNVQVTDQAVRSQSRFYRVVEQ